MFIDLHMHEMTYSKDSFLALEEIVSIAKTRGWGKRLSCSPKGRNICNSFPRRGKDIRRIHYSI